MPDNCPSKAVLETGNNVLANNYDEPLVGTCLDFNRNTYSNRVFTLRSNLECNAPGGCAKWCRQESLVNGFQSAMMLTNVTCECLYDSIGDLPSPLPNDATAADAGQDSTGIAGPVAGDDNDSEFITCYPVKVCYL